MFDIVHETAINIAAREALLDSCFGSARLAKTCERLREGRLPAEGLALTLRQDDALVGTVRLWNVAAGPGRPALLLGPVAVDRRLQGLGLGTRLVRDALDRAAAAGHAAVLLVGAAPYYGRFGFSREAVGSLWLPGPYEAERFLGLELRPGALAAASGLVSATGARVPRPDLAALIGAAAMAERGLSRAA